MADDKNGRRWVDGGYSLICHPTAGHDCPRKRNDGRPPILLNRAPTLRRTFASCEKQDPSACGPDFIVKESRANQSAKHNTGSRPLSINLLHKL